MALTTNLVSYWKLDESSGDAADSTATANTLTNYNTATYSAVKINNGVVTNGSSYLRGSPYTPGTSDFSISLWFKTTSTTACRIAGAAAGNNTRNFIDIDFGTTGKLNFEVGWSVGGNTGVGTDVSASSYNDGNCHHLVLVASNPSSLANIKIYVDGSQIFTETHASRSYDIINLTAFSIGSGINWTNGSIDTPTFNGSVDECGVWSRALTSTEVTQLYNGGAGLAYPFATASNNPAFLLKMI